MGDQRPSIDPCTTAEVISKTMTTISGLRREMTTSLETVSKSDTWVFFVFRCMKSNECNERASEQNRTPSSVLVSHFETGFIGYCFENLV